MDADSDACRVMAATFGHAIRAVKFPLHAGIGTWSAVARLANPRSIPDVRRLTVAAMAVT